MASLKLLTTLAGARFVATDLFAVGRVRGRRNLRLSRNGRSLLYNGDVVDDLIGLGILGLLQLLVCQKCAYDRDDERDVAGQVCG